MSTPSQQPDGGSHEKNAHLRQRVKRLLLATDATFDTTTWRAGNAIGQTFETYSSFIHRFRVQGLARLFSELASDALTFGLIGLVLMLALAQPAFKATARADWRTTEDFSVTFLDRFGNDMGRRGIFLNDTVPLEDLPDQLVQAALATEDRRFFEHFGIDIVGTFRAMGENLRARSVVQGGSSITQQLAKNLFLSNERTLQRKIKEAFLALWLEANLTKHEILKLYLDRAYMGGGTFGVAAAAEFYFGKNVRDLSLAESAMLGGLFKAPSKYAPHINLPAARARANVVLSNMVKAGYMTEGQVIIARQNPATAVDRSKDILPDYFLDYAFEQVKNLAKTHPKLANNRIVTVHTTLDPELQRQSEQAVLSTLRQYGDRYNVEEAATALVATSTGAVRAMVGGKNYGSSQFNRAVHALRQPGSSFKPFVYITAFMNGYTPTSVMPDAPITIDGWTPRNYGRSYRGAVTLKDALTRSINTVPVRLAQAIGQEKIIETAHNMGIASELQISRALPLGVEEVNVLEMAHAYGAFATGGLKVTPHAIIQITDSSGEIIYDWSTERQSPKRIIPAQAAAQMNKILVNAIENGTGRKAKIPGLRAAGKTGTTQSYRDAWFVGYTGSYSLAVWFGNDDFSTTRNMTGGSLPAITWRIIMANVHQETKPSPLPGVDGPPTSNTDNVATAQITDVDPAQTKLLREASISLLTAIGRDFEKGKRDLHKTSQIKSKPPVTQTVNRQHAGHDIQETTTQ